MMRRHLAILLVFGAAASVALLAQTAGTAPRLEYEVASVKPHTSDDQRVMMVVQPGGRFVAQNVPLKFVIRTAYQIQDDQIVDGPAWLTTDRFDIQARAADPTVTAAVHVQMLQALLSERFALATHREPRELPVFALVPARRDGTLGPKMKPTECPPTDVDLATLKPCANIAYGRASLIMRGASVAAFTQFLAPIVSRVVVDRTALTDRYDIELTWTPEPPASAGVGAAATADNSPSIFTAIQEQLGLKLDATRAPVDALVIDHVDRPSPD